MHVVHSILRTCEWVTENEDPSRKCCRRLRYARRNLKRTTNLRPYRCHLNWVVKVNPVLVETSVAYQICRRPKKLNPPCRMLRIERREGQSASLKLQKSLRCHSRNAHTGAHVKIGVRVSAG